MNAWHVVNFLEVLAVVLALALAFSVAVNAWLLVSPERLAELRRRTEERVRATMEARRG